MIKENWDDLKGVKKEEYISNLVGLTLEDFRSLRKIISNGIPELIEIVRKEIISRRQSLRTHPISFLIGSHIMPAP